MQINKDTILCLSLSARPSNFGTRFHNFLYQELGLNFAYKGCAVEDIEGAVRGIRALGIRGSAVSMPHKETVMKFLDEIDAEAATIGAVNTIVNEAVMPTPPSKVGVIAETFEQRPKLKGYNTDFLACANLFAPIDKSLPTVLLGSGGMAKAIAHALEVKNFASVTIVSRNESAGRGLADKYGFDWSPKVPENARFLINATPIGMAPDPGTSVPFSDDVIERADLVMDSVASPSETGLIKRARAMKKKVITGFDIVSLQAVEQFRLYTGVSLPETLFMKAADWART